MDTVVGVFHSRSDAERAVSRLKSAGIAARQIQLLLPGSAGADLAALPTEDAEQGGMGKAVGGVVGGAVGASAGLGLGAAAASLLIPGIGPVTAIGLAAAALFGAGGALGGAAAGEALEDQTREGLPKDELYLYEDALAHGRSIVFVMAGSHEQVRTSRECLEAAGAESLDAAAQSWWVGVRAAEKEHYEKAGGDFDAHENHYRQGFVAALSPESRGKRLDEMPAQIRERYRASLHEDAFRRGYERGQKHARDIQVLRPESSLAAAHKS